MASVSSLIQKVNFNTTTAAPSTATPTYASTQVGSCLVCMWSGAMSASGGSLTFPAGWVQIASLTSFGSAIAYGVAVYFNNPGAITNVAITSMTNFNGFACELQEWSGAITALNPVDLTSVATQLNNTASTSSNSGSKTPTQGNEIWCGLFGSLTASTMTATNLPAAGIGAWTNQGSATSTNGATNIQQTGFTAQPGPVYPSGGVMQISCTYGTSQPNFALMFALVSQIANSLGNAWIEGLAGSVGPYNGVVGG